LTTAILEPKAQTAANHQNHSNDNHASDDRNSQHPTGHRHQQSATGPAHKPAANAKVSASEIEIDPVTHLPFLKDVHFDDFDISSTLKQKLGAAGFRTPTPVQAKAIPPALEERDILATASTGTGKTLSFLVPMIELMDRYPLDLRKGEKSPIRSLILLPTRELAMQVLEAYAKLVPNAKNDAVLVCGGLSENVQLENLRKGPRIVVATPGRLEDYLRRRAVSLRDVEMLVLDEVDRMLDMGFLPAIRRIVGALPRDRQTMCYSATLDANISEIVRDYVYDPVRIEIGQTSKPSEQVELRVYTVMQDQKLGLLEQMLNEEQGTFLVFVRTKHGAERIARKLEKLGHDVDAIHGDRSQSQRTAALKGFAGGKHRVLVATDVAARGIDVQDIAHVVNYDMPNAPEDFVHRIGRTGRAGAKGVATTFVMPQERVDARRFEASLKVKFDWREADKNLMKEERNKPLDLAKSNPMDLLSLESRSWKTPGANVAAEPVRANGGGSGSQRRRRSGGGQSSAPNGGHGSHGRSSGGGHNAGGSGSGSGRRRRRSGSGSARRG
jgi:ATP-dependent RNA helicase RhlE